ncbi:MAG: nitroreductase [Robiginitomaculum sp.]|nr:nitroreductase [Robiginitomaculum sp.]
MPYIPVLPSLCQSLPASTPSAQVLDFLNQRRSTPLALLVEPGPQNDELNMILQLASRVPDHRRVVPWRFIIFSGAAKQQAAKVIGQRFLELNPQAYKNDADLESYKFSKAPVVIALIASSDSNHKTPVWEQSLTVGAVGQNLLLGSNAAGFAGVWLTCWYAYDQNIRQQFGVGNSEKIAGFFHLGTASENPVERPRPDMEQIISHWQPEPI